uniref:Uncharacterized protein n=1 Tax=Acrobeloides nanus TaxID=290746 RepID=A0A914EBD7_9BILA
MDVLPNMINLWEHVATRKVEIDGKKSQQLDLGCENFASPGFYRVRIRDLDDDKAISDAILINSTSSSSTPSINIRSDSIFPYCTNDFVVSWHLPSCNTSNLASFRIRVFSVLEDSPEELIYLDELTVEDNANTLAIPCSNFDILYEKFCFELISLQIASRKFELWDRKCVNTEPVVRIDGKWSLWTPWTECSKKCGSGLRKRYRKCSINKEIRGSYCNGTTMEKESCNVEKCPETPTQLYDNSLNNTCDCGCTVSRPSGTIFVGHTFCSLSFTKWVISSKPGHNIHFSIRDEGIYENEEKVQIFRGDKEILWQNNGMYPNFLEEPLKLDFWVIYQKNSNGSRRGSNGVYITYGIISDDSNTIDSEYSALIAARIPECTSEACQNTVVITLIVAISLVLFVIVFTPTLICVHVTQNWRRRKGKGTNSSDALLASISQRMNTEMLCSGGTECTHLSGSRHTQSHHLEQIPLTVTKRSIGIQLSVQSTPRFSRSARDTPRGNASIISGELEYDYYDPPVPGSILRPFGDKFLDEFVSEIDIDQIVRRETSGWVETPPDKCDVHTQI